MSKRKFRADVLREVIKQNGIDLYECEAIIERDTKGGTPAAIEGGDKIAHMCNTVLINYLTKPFPNERKEDMIPWIQRAQAIHDVFENFPHCKGFIRYVWETNFLYKIADGFSTSEMGRIRKAVEF